jgi:hypothetical protein
MSETFVKNADIGFEIELDVVDFHRGYFVLVDGMFKEHHIPIDPENAKLGDVVKFTPKPKDEPKIIVPDRRVVRPK